MKITPMLFNDEMVRAIVDGRKTQTRRIVKPRRGWPIDFIGGVGSWDDPSCWGFESESGEFWTLQADEGEHQIPCPYGKPGDLIYVRETFGEWPAADSDRREDSMIYRATDDDWECRMFNWKASIHMPRWASRLTLKIKSVRIERLQDISEEDAKAEGVSPNCVLKDHSECGDHHGEYIRYANPMDWDDAPAYSATESFQTLWDAINGLDSWDANSWVWRVEYEPIMQNVDVYLSELENAA